MIGSGHHTALQKRGDMVGRHLKLAMLAMISVLTRAAWPAPTVVPFASVLDYPPSLESRAELLDCELPLESTSLAFRCAGLVPRLTTVPEAECALTTIATPERLDFTVKHSLP